MMRRAILSCALALFFVAPAARASDRSDAKKQVEFGIKVAFVLDPAGHVNEVVQMLAG